ncbi:MAG: hypothetical protein ACJ71Z_04445 [Aeromicrobium sp.]
MIARILLGTTGIAVAAFGGWTLVMNQRPDQLLAAGEWLAGAVIGHDALLAPTALVIGWLLVRALPQWARGPAAAGGIVLGTLTLVAVPVLGAFGRRPDNPSLLPRDYWAGWLAVAAVVALCVMIAALVARSRARSTA